MRRASPAASLNVALPPSGTGGQLSVFGLLGVLASVEEGLEVNLLGPTRIALTLHDLGVTPHLVAVSTCYVAGNRRGTAPEEHVGDSDFFLDIDWRGEVGACRRAR